MHRYQHPITSKYPNYNNNNNNNNNRGVQDQETLKCTWAMALRSWVEVWGRMAPPVATPTLMLEARLQVAGEGRGRQLGQQASLL